MRSLRTVIVSGLRLGSGQIIVQGCSFFRSVIVARLISVDDYGVAAAFAMTLTLLEMISNLSFDKLLVQASDGNAEAFQKTAQLVQVTRGITNGLILFALAGLIARLFGIPQAVWGFRCLALLPVMRGFLHLDANRMQREMRFGPAVRIDVVSNVLVTLVAWPLAAWLRNYYAMLVLLLMQVAAAIVVSHLVAERRYGWAWERRYAHRMFSFGWPLLINGLLLYGIMHGDRVIIGSAKQLFPHAIYTLKNLGEYSIAFSVMMAPAVFVGNVTTSLFLPVLSRARAFPLDFQRSYHRIFALICLIAGLITIPCIVAGPKLLVWIYGPKYSAAGGLVGIFAAMWGLRIIRYVPSVAALSSGDTRSPMVSNLVRSLTFVVSIYAAAAGQPLVWIAVAGLLGDFLALPTLMWQVSHRHGADSRPCLMPLAVIGAGASISFLLAHFSQTDALASVVFLKTLSTTGITAGLLIALTPPLRADLQSATLAVSNFFRTELISSRARPEHITASNPE